MITKEEFEAYLESIGGLNNPYAPEKPVKERHFFSVNDGWLELLKNCIQECIDAGWDKNICQVKEKFGGLRFYIGSASPEVHKVISKYEDLSFSTCEVCEEPGEIDYGGRWLITACPAHKKPTSEELQDAQVAQED